MARTEIRVGRYVIDFVPVLFLVITAILCNQLNESVQASSEALKLANDMNRQRTAAEMRAQKAEKSPADNSSLNVIVIQPDGKQRASYTEPAFADMNKPL